MIRLFAILLLCIGSRAADWYVSPGASGSGTLGSPGNLTNAFSGFGWASSISPGDTIWMRGGTYSGPYSCDLSGASNAPIIIRNYQGERAVIDGGETFNTQPTILYIKGSFVWVWGIEVMSSSTDRVATVSGSGPSGAQIPYGDGVEVYAGGGPISGVKFINMIVHDTRLGFSSWSNSWDIEFHGNLSYYNGWWSTVDNAHGHGFYGQNLQIGRKTVSKNFFFDNFDNGSQSYGSEIAPISWFTFDRNAYFRNGSIGGGSSSGCWIGGGQASTNSYLFTNYFWSVDSGAINVQGNYSNRIIGNYLAGRYSGNGADIYLGGNTGLEMTNNVFIYDFLSGVTTGSFPNNTWMTTNPSTTVSFVDVNDYETNRANVVIYNWSLSNNVQVAAGSILSSGQQYRIRCAHNYWNDVATNTAGTGGVITIPMTNRTVVQPSGWTNSLLANTYYPNFGLFVVEALGGGGGGGGFATNSTGSATTSNVGTINKI